ncbi:hypothetical protein GCM10027176_41460 [Actinoallomurus bryophytorum]|uniref:Uncharacterized protein n=2 Tax=Actinoallomurus bryophytorum TaxID=1490222 RepID=A0A543C1E0_9ACTN|nr:hypothetical protein FB559_8210 [Actinoallomurus bryophytorum]
MEGDAAIPDGVRDVVSALRDLLGDVTPPRRVKIDDDPVRAAFARGTNLEDESVVGISGARGSGKTTLLMALCVELLSDQKYIVLPLIRPEMFRASDSLLSIIVSHVRTMIEACLDGRGEKTSDVTQVSSVVQRAFRAAVLATGRPVLANTLRTASLTQYALDSEGLLSFQENLVPSVAALMRLLREVANRDRDAIVVIPIDDGDLVPRRTREIMEDLRIILSVGGVAPVVCMFRDDLRVHLTADLVHDFGVSVSGAHAERLAVRQIDKLISPARTVSPPYLRYERRMAFTPIGETVPLSDLLFEIFRRLDPNGGTAEELVTFLSQASDPHLEEPVTGISWLPETPRRLQNLWRVSDQLVRALRNNDTPSISPWLKHFVDIVAQDAEYGVRLDIESVESARKGVPVSVKASAAWTKLNLSVRPIGMWTNTIDEPLGKIRLRRFGGPVGDVGSDGPGQGQAGNGAVEIPFADVASALFIEDLFRLSAFQPRRPTGPAHLIVSDFSYLQEIKLLQQDTDDLFLSIPISYGATYLSRSQKTWNALVLRTQQSWAAWNNYERLITDYIGLVTTMWLDGEDIGPGASLPTLAEAVDRAGVRYLQYVAEFKRNSLVFDDYSPGKAFCYWYEMTLPRCFNELFIASEPLKWIIANWSATLTRGGRSSRALEELRQLFRDRVTKNMNPPQRPGNDGLWLVGYRQLLEYVSEELLSLVEPLTGDYDKRRARSALGRATTSESVDITDRRGNYEYAARANDTGTANLALISTIMAELRQ